jgi:hypothetical protein
VNFSVSTKDAAFIEKQRQCLLELRKVSCRLLGPMNMMNLTSRAKATRACWAWGRSPAPRFPQELRCVCSDLCNR